MRSVYDAEAPGASSGMVTNVPGAVIRSPTYSSGSRVLSKARSVESVIGSGLMNACTLIADQVSSDSLVTQPLIRTLPFWGIEDGVSCSIVIDSGASPSARAAAGPVAAAGPAESPMARPVDRTGSATTARAGSSVDRRGTPRL